MKSEKRMFAGWLLWRMVIVAVIAIFFFFLSSAGMLGRTFVERKVFEQSYQRSAALDSQIATFEAQLAEIENQLRNHNMDEGARNNLEDQAAGLRVQISSAKAQQ